MEYTVISIDDPVFTSKSELIHHNQSGLMVWNGSTVNLSVTALQHGGASHLVPVHPSLDLPGGDGGGLSGVVPSKEVTVVVKQTEHTPTPLLPEGPGLKDVPPYVS